MSRKLAPELVEMLDQEIRDEARRIRVLPVSEVAYLMGVSQKTVRRLIDDGSLPVTKIVKGNRGTAGVTFENVVAYIRASTFGQVRAS